MEQAEQILSEMRNISKTMTDIQVSHGKLETRSEERHDVTVKSIDNLSTQIGNQNGRVTKLEHFKTTILTKIKVIPATISTIFGIITVAIAMYFRS